MNRSGVFFFLLLVKNVPNWQSCPSFPALSLKKIVRDLVIRDNAVIKLYKS